MYSGRMTMSAGRKSRVEGKPSLLPKPWRQGSTDRASGETRRPSNSYRSSSAEPVRSTLGGRLSRDASASKLPMNQRSRSQQPDKYGKSSMTPLRSSQYSRTTTTPVRTPSEDRVGRSWQASMDRALAFVTVKDQRPISTMAWQRAEFHRVLEGLAARGAGDGAAGGGQPALTKPLTITRFVAVCGDLLTAILVDVPATNKLNNDNYITKLPNLAKRYLYPGTVSKSWLKTVNTLHAFPHALAFLAYFLDLVNHLQNPVSDEWLYLEKDELACLRRDFLHRSWMRFQEPEPEFGDIVADYIERLKQLLGNDKDKVTQLEETIERCQATLEDETELAARADEERLRSRREAHANKLKAIRAERRAARERIDAELAKYEERAGIMKGLDADINHTTEEIQTLKRELETQSMSQAERCQLADELDYATRVADCKRTLSQQLSKMLVSKETELAVWQRRTLDSCVEYKHLLVTLAASVPALAALALDEQELMRESIVEAVSGVVETLRAHAHQYAELRTRRCRDQEQRIRQRRLFLEESVALMRECRARLSRLAQETATDVSSEIEDTALWEAEKEKLRRAILQLGCSEADYQKVCMELQHWDAQDKGWSARLTDLQDHITSLAQQSENELDAIRNNQLNLLLDFIHRFNHQLDLVETEENKLDINKDGAEKDQAKVKTKETNKNLSQKVKHENKMKSERK